MKSFRCILHSQCARRSLTARRKFWKRTSKRSNNAGKRKFPTKMRLVVWFYLVVSVSPTFYSRAFSFRKMRFQFGSVSIYLSVCMNQFGLKCVESVWISEKKNGIVRYCAFWIPFFFSVWQIVKAQRRHQQQQRDKSRFHSSGMILSLAMDIRQLETQALHYAQLK